MVKIKHEVDNVKKNLVVFLKISTLEKTLFQKVMHFCVCSQSKMTMDDHMNTTIKLDYTSRPLLIPGVTFARPTHQFQGS